MKLLSILFVFVGTMFASDVEIYTSKNVDKSITAKTIGASFKNNGFHIVSNRDMNVPFKLQFKTSDFDIYNLFTLFDEDIISKIAVKYPEIGMFAPMSMSIYSKKNSNKISVAFLNANALAKIVGINSKNELALLAKLEAKIRKSLATAMPKGSYEKIPYKILEQDKKLITRYELELDADEWDDDKDDFEMSLEGELKPNGFVKAGFTDLSEVLTGKSADMFDFYDTMSVCKLPVIYNISKTKPEAGAFAPCSIFMYKLKNENIMHIGYPNVYNWFRSLSIDDTKLISTLMDAQNRMVSILDSSTE